MIHGKRSKHQHKWNLEEVDSNPYEWLWGVQVDEVTEDMVETARELELEVEPEDVMNYCNLIIKLFIGEELLLKDEQRKWFLGMETTPGEDALKIVEMTRKDLELYVNLVDKAVAEFENTDYWLQFWKKFYCR